MASRWINEFETHSFHQVWKELSEAVDQCTVGDDVGYAIHSTEELVRLKKLIAYIDGQLSAIDPELIVLTDLHEAHSAVAVAIAHLESYIGREVFEDQNPIPLEGANEALDALIPLFQRMPRKIGFRAESKSLQKMLEVQGALISFQTGEMEKLTEGLLHKLKSAQGQLGTLKETTTAEGLRIAQRLSEVESQINQQITNQTTAFQESETNRSHAFENSQTNRSERHDKWSGHIQQKADDAFIELTTKAGITLSVLTSLRQEVEQVAGTVIHTAQAGAYATYANQQKRSADVHRLGAIAFMLMASSVLLLPVLMQIAGAAEGSPVIDWRQALYRIPFSLVLLVPAFYMSRESTKHRNNEIRNRRREHILRTIEPYVTRLDPSRAEDIRTEVAKNLFSDQPLPEDKSHDAYSVDRLLDQLSKVLKDTLKRGE